MPFVPSDAVAHIKCVGSTDGQETVNDLYFRSTSGPITFLGLSTLVAALNTWYTNSIAPLLSETWIGNYVYGRDLTSEFSFVDKQPMVAVVGGVSGEQSPNNVSANITFSTTLAGRNNHGSNRIPAIANSLITTNELDATWLGNIVEAYSLLIAPSTALPGGWTWVVLSQYSGFTIVDGKKVPTPRVAGVFHEIFTCFFTDNIVDSQKSRLPKHGR